MKTTLGGINELYPTPTVLVGKMVTGKPNYITITHIGIVNHARPYLFSLSMAKGTLLECGIQGKQSFQCEHPIRKPGRRNRLRWACERQKKG